MVQLGRHLIATLPTREYDALGFILQAWGDNIFTASVSLAQQAR
jgi:hypothetical protein